MESERGFALVLLFTLTLVSVALGAKDKDLYCGGEFVQFNQRLVLNL